MDYGPALPASGNGAIAPVPATRIAGVTAFGPVDFYSYYNQSPLFAAGYNGASGDCLAVVGDSNYLPGAVALFNSQFGLQPSDITTILVNGTNPGVTSDENESLLDLEWSHAVAPGAPTRFYLGNPFALTANGPIVDGIQRAVHDNACGTIAVSFGLCGGAPSFYTGTVSPIFAQAAAQGQSILIASGDFGAAGAVLDPVFRTCVPGTSRHINELGGDPNVTEVGGTFFIPGYNPAGNIGSGYEGESAWNALYANPPPLPPTQLATGGGASVIYKKPAYQKGVGVPADGARDVPDVAMLAALSDPNGPGVFFGADQRGLPAMQCCLVGTSLSAQLWAGLSKLIAQIMGRRLGPLNPSLYAVANGDLGASGFQLITTGNNDYGSVAGFAASFGYNQTAGWGTVDIATFADTIAPTPVIGSVPSPILVGSSFNITGNSFSRGPKVNFFVTTGGYAVRNEGPLTPSFVSPTRLIVPLPATVPLGQGFVAVQVINADLGFKASNVATALLQGSARPASLPSRASMARRSRPAARIRDSRPTTSRL